MLWSQNESIIIQIREALEVPITSKGDIESEQQKQQRVAELQQRVDTLESLVSQLRKQKIAIHVQAEANEQIQQLRAEILITQKLITTKSGGLKAGGIGVAVAAGAAGIIATAGAKTASAVKSAASHAGDMLQSTGSSSQVEAPISSLPLQHNAGGELQQASEPISQTEDVPEIVSTTESMHQSSLQAQEIGGAARESAPVDPVAVVSKSVVAGEQSTSPEKAPESQTAGVEAPHPTSGAPTSAVSFESMDLNGDGVVDRNEWSKRHLALPSAVMGASPGQTVGAATASTQSPGYSLSHSSAVAASASTAVLEASNEKAGSSNAGNTNTAALDKKVASSSSPSSAASSGSAMTHNKRSIDMDNSLAEFQSQVASIKTVNDIVEQRNTLKSVLATLEQDIIDVQQQTELPKSAAQTLQKAKAVAARWRKRLSKVDKRTKELRDRRKMLESQYEEVKQEIEVQKFESRSMHPFHPTLIVDFVVSHVQSDPKQAARSTSDSDTEAADSKVMTSSA